MKTQRGFTLIEIVVVIVLIGILAAVALPRFFNFTTEAERAAVDGTAGAIASGISMAQNKWMLNNQEAQMVIGNQSFDMSGRGYPMGFAGASSPSTINADACAAIATNVLSDNSVTFGVAGQGDPDNYDYIAVPYDQAAPYVGN